MKKSVCLILFSLLLCGTMASSLVTSNKNGRFLDELDQSQTQFNGDGVWVGRYEPANRQGAQSFIPQKGILTRVDLYLSRWEVVPASEPFHLAIRETLTGATLTETSINPNTVPIYDFAWITFDISDIPVNVGETYFLVGYSNDSAYHGMYWWGGIGTNPYANGLAYYLDEVSPNWQPSASVDLCFKTYGIDNDPPEPPSITGTSKGQYGESYEYTFSAIEPDGENVKYVIDWGDDTTDETTFVASGVSVTVNHTWSSQGLYTLRAKAVDIIGKESEWETMSIRMPISYQCPVWQWLNDHFPLLLRILNILL